MKLADPRRSDAPLRRRGVDGAAAGSAGALAGDGTLLVAATLAGRPPGDVARLAAAMLRAPATNAGPGDARSDLTPTGAPLQLLLSARAARWRARLIADPAYDRADPLERWDESLAALADTLEAAGALALRGVAHETLATMVPDASEERRRYPTGMLRLALALDGVGAAMYVGAPPSGGWASARRWAERVLCEPTGMLNVIAALEPVATLFGVGIEGASEERGRAKLYWRLHCPEPLASFGVPLLASPGITGFLRAIMGERDFPASAITFSAGFSLATGQLADAKADVCNHTAGHATAATLGLVNERARALGLAPPVLAGVQALLVAHHVHIGCVGAGIDRAGAHRLNVYLHHSPPELSAPT
jgi:hypothetical protein